MSILTRALLAAVIYSGPLACHAAIPDGILNLEVRDKSTGRIEPAMVCITSLADRKWRTPPDGRTPPPYSTVPDFFDPPAWRPGQIGPVRLTNGEYNDLNVRSFAYEGRSALPFWQEPAAYFVSQPFSIRLPAGKWRLAVARGIEYLPVFEEFVLEPGQTRNRSIALMRWVDMPRRGWYSGDGHVHHPRLKPENDELLLTWARAEDVHLLNILLMGDIEKTYFEQRSYGRPSRHQWGDYALVSGQEDPRAAIKEQGHAIAVNITAPVRDTAKYHLFDFMFDGVHAQGGLVGYAHKAWASGWHRRARPESWPTWDSTINVPRGKVDFFEILQFRRIGLEDFYDFLNLGYKLTASAGSDLPWGNTVGESRVYAYTGPSFSVDSWFGAIKQGRTFVTNGPMLQLHADGAMPGDEVRVRRNAGVRIRARAWAPESIGSPKLLDVVAHGRVIRSAQSAKSGANELRLDFRLPADESKWIAARVVSHNGAQAHTSPIYLLVDGKGFEDRRHLAALARKRLRVLDYIEEYLRTSDYAKSFGPGEAAGLEAAIAEARGTYQQLVSRPE